jgi:hypothetical protein
VEVPQGRRKGEKEGEMGGGERRERVMKRGPEGADRLAPPPSSNHLDYSHVLPLSNRWINLLGRTGPGQRRVRMCPSRTSWCAASAHRADDEVWGRREPRGSPSRRRSSSAAHVASTWIDSGVGRTFGVAAPRPSSALDCPSSPHHRPWVLHDDGEQRFDERRG